MLPRSSRLQQSVRVTPNSKEDYRWKRLSDWSRWDLSWITVVKYNHGYRSHSHRFDCTLDPNADWKKPESSNSKRLNFKISRGQHAPTSTRRLATSALESMPKPLKSMAQIWPQHTSAPWKILKIEVAKEYFPSFRVEMWCFKSNHKVIITHWLEKYWLCIRIPTKATAVSEEKPDEEMISVHT